MSKTLKFRNKEYTPKFEYKDWKPSISTVDKYRFTISLGDEYHSNYSEVSFEDAEEKVFKSFSGSQGCDHEWVRSYSHAKYGHCDKCGLNHRDKFESPFVCSESSCEKLGDFALAMEQESLEDGHFCFTHYLSNLKDKVDRLNSYAFEELPEIDKNYEIIMTFNYYVLSYLIEKNLVGESIKEKEDLIRETSFNYNRLLHNFFGEKIKNNGGFTNGEFWSFKSKLNMQDIKFFADYYLIESKQAIELKTQDHIQAELSLKEKN